MKASYKLLVGVFFLVLGACATSLEILEKNLGALKGAHIDRLVEKIGEPDEQKFPPGKKFYVWKWNKTEKKEICNNIWDGTTIIGEYCLPYKANYYCNISVEIGEGEIILSSIFKGNAGGCERFARPFRKSGEISP